MFDIEVLQTELRILILDATSLPKGQAWQNHTFDKPNPGKTTVWLRETFSIIKEDPAATEVNTVIGQSTYDVFVSAGQGTKLCSFVAQQIREAVPRGTWIRPAAPACSVHVNRTERLGGRLDPRNAAWYFEPVRIAWWSTDPNKYVP